jgi:hypothetical protein
LYPYRSIGGYYNLHYKRSKRYNEKATEAQYFNAYVLDLFVNSPRIVPLLKEMATAQVIKKTP